jgi:hypothetical protein
MRGLRSHPLTALALVCALLLQACVAALLMASHAAAASRDAWVVCGRDGPSPAGPPARHGDDSCLCGTACASACAGCAPVPTAATAWRAGGESAASPFLRGAAGHLTAFRGGRPGSRAPPAVL